MNKKKVSQTRKQLVLDIFNKPYLKIVLVTLIFTVALTIRLYSSIHSLETNAGTGIGTFGDTFLYHKIAYNLYSGNGFSGSDNGAAYGSVRKSEDIKYEPAIARGPIYPFFISIIYKFFGNPKDMDSIKTWRKNWNKVRKAQCLLDAIVCLLVFFIVRLIYPTSFWPAIISASLQAFNLYSIYYTKTLLSESLTTFLLSAAILLYIKALQKKERKWWILAGMGFGVVVLSRPEYILSLFVLAAFIIIVNRSFLSDAFKKSIIFIIGALIVISPWTLRNFMVFERPIPVSVGGAGYSLFQGTWQSTNNWDWGRFPDEIYKDEKEKKKIETLDRGYRRALNAGTIEIKTYDDAFMEIALDRIRENPGKIFLNWITTIPNLWYQNWRQIYQVKEPSGNFFLFYFVFAVYAFFRGKREEKILMGPVYLLFVYLTVIFLPLHIEARYSVALIPGIISLSGIGIWKAISRLISILEN